MAEPVTARQNAIYDCTHIYIDAFDKKGPIGELYSEAVAEYLERFIKTENCFMYTLIEKDVIVGFLTAGAFRPGLKSISGRCSIRKTGLTIRASIMTLWGSMN